MANQGAASIREVTALSFCRRMRGGAQSSLLLCDDGNLYVTKFHHNPQGSSVLANEWIGTALAHSVGLPVSRWARVRIPKRFVDNNPDIYLHYTDRTEPLNAGCHFGSLFLSPDANSPRIFEYLNSSQKASLESSSSFIGIKLFDILTESTDRRQAIFSSSRRTSATTTTFIDFGSHFRGPSWLSTPSLSGLVRLAGPQLWKNRRLVEFWLTRFKKRLPAALESSVRQVPPEWYAGDLNKMTKHYMERIDTFDSMVLHFIAQSSPSLLQQAFSVQ